MPHVVETHETPGLDFVPQAELKISLNELRERIPLDHSTDDLDDYLGATLHLRSGFRFSVKNYRGFPRDVFAIYFERMSNMQHVSDRLGEILDSLRISRAALIWSRPDDGEPLPEERDVAAG